MRLARLKARRAAAVFALLAAIAAAPAATPDRPVRIGLAGDDLDACLSAGIVANLDPRGDNFLAVRAAPSTRARMLFRLEPRHPVHICEEAGGGQWLGVVVPVARRTRLDCRVGSPVPRPQAYPGPCRSGWVAARYVTIIAG
jgi:hypothetical protein